jgi:hypothetical protein
MGGAKRNTKATIKITNTHITLNTAEDHSPSVLKLRKILLQSRK